MTLNMNLSQAIYNFLKVFLFCSAFLATVPCTVLAQINTQISGKIMDERGPVEFADIILFKKTDTTKRLASVLSDSTGKFIFKKIPPGVYIASVELVGFSSQKIDIALTENNTSLDLGIIKLETVGGTLNTITITAQRKLIQKTPQGFIIKAEDNITQAAGTASDLLANTPTVLVDAEGGISIRGKSPLILINGRNSALGARSLDRIPASSIEKIEIINNPSAQYDADAEGGIINITLKKNRSPRNQWSRCSWRRIWRLWQVFQFFPAKQPGRQMEPGHGI